MNLTKQLSCLFLVCLIFCVFDSFAQSKNQIVKKNSINKKSYTAVEQAAEFPGGAKGFGIFLQDNLRYPPAAQTANIGGVVYIQFVVNQDRSVTDFEILKSVGFGCDEEAIRVLKLTSGMWTPGKQNGMFVRSRFTQPVTFTLTN